MDFEKGSIGGGLMAHSGRESDVRRMDEMPELPRLSDETDRLHDRLAPCSRPGYGSKHGATMIGAGDSDGWLWKVASGAYSALQRAIAAWRAI